MSKSARLGLFALATIALLLGFLYIVGSFAGIGSGYRMAVHFASASGMPAGSQVFFSGVDVGTVNKVRILPDASVEVILSIHRNIDIPKQSTFTIRPSLTGAPSVVIVPPSIRIAQDTSPTPWPRGDALPKRVLPLSQQVVGVTPLSIEQVMREGFGVERRAMSLLTIMRATKAGMQQKYRNAVASRAQLEQSVVDLDASLKARQDEISSRLHRPGEGLTAANRRRLTRLAGSMQQARSRLSQTALAARAITANPALRANAKATSRNVGTATDNAAALKSDLHNVTGNPQTRAQLNNAGTNVHALMQQLTSLFGKKPVVKRVNPTPTASPPQ